MHHRINYMASLRRTGAVVQATQNAPSVIRPLGLIRRVAVIQNAQSGRPGGSPEQQQASSAPGRYDPQQPASSAIIRRPSLAPVVQQQPVAIDMTQVVGKQVSYCHAGGCLRLE